MNNSISNQTTNKIGRFDWTNLTKDQHSADYIHDSSQYVCIIPFERTPDNRLKSLYLLQFTNPITNEINTSLLIDSINSDFDKNSYDTINRSLIEEAGINVDELGLTENDIFYVGDITMAFPFTYAMKCYAIDVTDKNSIEFTRALAKDVFTKDSSSIVKVGFHQIVNGDYSDSTILAGCFLLVSYFN